MAEPQVYKLCDWIGYLTRPEADLLIKWARKLSDNPVVINIGAGVGTSGMAFMEARPDLTLYTVDVNDYPNPYGGLVNERNAFEWSGFLGQARHHQIHEDSKVFGQNWKGDKVDLVFIDGDHDEGGIDGDLKYWLPHVAKGGIVIIHDYFSPFYGAVKMVTDRYFKPGSEVDKADSMIVYKIAKAKQ